MTPLLTIVISGVIGIITAVTMWMLNKRQYKAQTEGLIADQYYKLTERLRQEREDLEARITRNDILIKSLEKKDKDNKIEIRTLKEDNEECKYLHEVAELQMKHLKLKTNEHKWKREMVYILDDDEEVLEDFRKKLVKVTVLDYQSFHDVDNFMESARKHKPQIIVIDYMLNRGLTAEYVIENLGYEPEIFIMSSEKGFFDKFKNDKIKFFEKTDNYILRIAKAVIQYLIIKN